MHHPRADDGLWSPRRRALTVGLVLTVTLVAFEALAISTVMPSVSDDLGGLDLYGWVFSAFFLASLVGIVVVGASVDRHGLAKPFGVGLVLFGIGLLVGGLAPSMPVLVAARFVQGLGAGAIPPIAYVAIGRSLPEHLRARMFATLSTAWILPGLAGPSLAAGIGETVGWRFVFLGLLPLIGLSGALTLGALRSVAVPAAEATSESGAAAAARARLPLAIRVAAGAGLITLGLTLRDPVPMVLLVGLGVPVGLVALRRLTPPGTLSARPVVPAAILLRGLLTFMFFGIDAFVSLALVDWRDLSLSEAGITLTAATIVWTGGSWVQARGSTRWPTRRFVQVGFTTAFAGLALFSLVLIPEVPWLFAIPAFALAGFGMGLSYSPQALIVLRESAPELQGAMSSALSLTDTLGTALGTGVAGAIIAAGVRVYGGLMPGLAIAFMSALAVGLVGILLTSRLSHRALATPVGAGAPARPSS
jgi:MFS family permease